MEIVAVCREDWEHQCFGTSSLWDHAKTWGVQLTGNRDHRF